jgi:hypothetical protein
MRVANRNEVSRTLGSVLDTIVVVNQAEENVLLNNDVRPRSILGE